MMTGVMRAPAFQPRDLTVLDPMIIISDEAQPIIEL
jgi:hypothetical protein